MSSFLNQSDLAQPGKRSKLLFRWFDPNDYIPDRMPADSVTVWPFGGGTGRLRFHISYQTVPAERRHNAIFVPPGILSHCDTPNRALALMIMSVATWPACFPKYTVAPEPPSDHKWLPEVDTDSSWHNAPIVGGLNGVLWALNQATVNIPGMNDIDVILPRLASSGIPRTQSVANNTTTLQPMTGPTPLQRGDISYPANQRLDINYMAGPDNSTSITDYINSWLPTMSRINVVSLLSAYNQLWGIDHIITASWYNAVALTQRFPPLLCIQKPPVRKISGFVPPPPLSQSGVRGSRPAAPLSGHHMGSSDMFANIVPSDECPSSSGRRVTRSISRSMIDLVGMLGNRTVSTPTLTQESERSQVDEEDEEYDSEAEDDDAETKVCFADITHSDASEQYTIMYSTTNKYDLAVEDRDHPLPFTNYNDEAIFRMYNFDVQAWNKVATGLATSPEFKKGSTLTIQPQLVDTMYVHTEVVEALQMGVPMGVLLGQFAVSNGPYRDAFNCTSFPRIRTLILACFATTSNPSCFTAGAMVKVLDNIYAYLYQQRLPTLAGPTIDSTSEITVYGRWHYMPMASVYADERIQAAEVHDGIPGDRMSVLRLYIPAILPEIWVQLLTKRTPLALASFPPPYGLHGPAGYHEGMSPVVIQTSYMTPYMEKATQQPYTPTSRLLTQDDKAAWNVRLFARCGLEGLGWRFLDGPLPEDAYIVGSLPTQIVTADPGWSPPSQKLIYTTTTLAFPLTWEDGRRVFPFCSIATANQISRIQLRLARASVATWLVGAMVANNPHVIADVSESDMFQSFLELRVPSADSAAIPTAVTAQATDPSVGSIAQAPPPEVPPAANEPLVS